MEHSVKEIFEGLFEDIVEISRGASGTNNLKRDPVPVGMGEVILYVGVIDETTAYTRLRIGRESLGKFFPMYEESNPVANELYWPREKIYIREGERLMAELTGVTANDILKMYIQGYRVRIKDV